MKPVLRHRDARRENELDRDSRTASEIDLHRVPVALQSASPAPSFLRLRGDSRARMFREVFVPAMIGRNYEEHPRRPRIYVGKGESRTRRASGPSPVEHDLCGTVRPEVIQRSRPHDVRRGRQALQHVLPAASSRRTSAAATREPKIADFCYGRGRTPDAFAGNLTGLSMKPEVFDSGPVAAAKPQGALRVCGATIFSPLCDSPPQGARNKDTTTCRRPCRNRAAGDGRGRQRVHAQDEDAGERGCDAHEVLVRAK